MYHKDLAYSMYNVCTGDTVLDLAHVSYSIG